MFPGTFWQKYARGMGCGGHMGFGPHGHGFRHGMGGGDDEAGGGFGVRRPLRFLAYKLELSDEQLEALARILDELKTERAQAAVDNRRAVSGFAEAVDAEPLDRAKLTAAADVRARSAERLRDAVVKALEQLHGLLTPEQRKQLAYLIRTGTVQL